MKILWVKSDFLHPTTRGGQIRTLEMLKRLHADHEIHYVGMHEPGDGVGLAQAHQYCSRAYPVPHSVPSRRSIRFAGQLIAGAGDRLPLSIVRYRSRLMRDLIGRLSTENEYESIVCDFLTPSVNFTSLDSVVLFQHNVETMIWERHAATAENAVASWYLRRQAHRMEKYEATVCRQVRHVVAVSDQDASVFRKRFGVSSVSQVSTGVDVDQFAPRAEPHRSDLVFVGSMDWLPNIDGIKFFVSEVLPLIRQVRPSTSLSIVGRSPTAELRELAARDPHITVTGTVDDVRPYLWGSSVSIVPLRIGGGTRLKIYEAMAAGVPVVSTSVGAEGLSVSSPAEIRIADSARSIAEACVLLLNDPQEHRRLASAALAAMATRVSWDRVAADFADVLRNAQSRGGTVTGVRT